jgi:hypothetical protein
MKIPRFSELMRIWDENFRPGQFNLRRQIAALSWTWKGVTPRAGALFSICDLKPLEHVANSRQIELRAEMDSP